MDPTVSHRRLSNAFVAASTNSSSTEIRRLQKIKATSLRQESSQARARTARFVALNRVHSALSSNSSCDPDVRAHPLCLAEPRSALFMLGALSTSPFLICLSLAPIYARVSSSLGSSSFLLLELLPSSSRNIRSR